MSTQRNYVAFDIETAKIVPGETFNWYAHRPLGITCIGSQISGEEPRVWCSLGADGRPAPQMARADLCEFVAFLADQMDRGVVPLSWNGLAFDFDVLAEETGKFDACRHLAMNHIDMMFHIVCEKGFPVALKNAATGLKLPGKLAGVEGIDAPRLWQAGQHETVLEYVAQDVRTTLAVAETSEARRSFAWTTRKGTMGTMPLANGWLTVRESLELPHPDMSWAADPPKRERFTAWLNKGAKPKRLSRR